MTTKTQPADLLAHVEVLNAEILSRIEAAQADAPGGGEVPREALEKLFRAFVRAGGVMTVARHGVDIDQDEFYRDVQHGVMEIERYLHPERFDEFPTGTAPGYGALARTKADQKWGEWSAVLRRLIGDRTEKLHFAAEVQAVGDGVRIDNCRFINKEPVGYISFGEYRESCDVTDDQRATWQPVWTSKPDAMLAAAPASEAKGPCCEHAGTFLCACGKFTLIEKPPTVESIAEMKHLLCWAYDNLNDMPVSDEWAAGWCKEFDETEFGKTLVDNEPAASSAAECQTCNGRGIVGGVMGQTPESMEQVTENCPDCSDDVTVGGTSSGDDELPGMWSPPDLVGGATDAAEHEQAEECRCPQHGSWIAADDVKRMVRQIDVALNGEDGAAKQASLCDVTSQIIRDAALLRRAVRVEVTDAMVDAAWLAYTGRATLGEAFAKDASCMLPCERQAMRTAITAALEPQK